MATLNITLDLDEVDETSITVWRSGTGEVVIRKGQHEGALPDAATASPDEEVADDALVEAIFTRWKGENSDSGAFELVRQLRKRGIAIVAPKNRKLDKNVEPYVRLLSRSASGLPVAAYVNTNSMVVSRQKLRATAASSTGADVHANGHVYFDVDDVIGCLAVVDQMLTL